jgi:uncharacterized protein HemX
MTRGAAKGFALVLVAGVIGFGTLGAIALKSANDAQHAAVALKAYQHKACLRGKKDRTGTADFQEAYARYNAAIRKAGSVKGDVKRAARELSLTVKRTAPQFRARARIRCPAAP